MTDFSTPGSMTLHTKGWPQGDHPSVPPNSLAESPVQAFDAKRTRHSSVRATSHEREDALDADAPARRRGVDEGAVAQVDAHMTV